MCTGTHAYIPMPSVAKAEVFFREDSQQLENVFHFYHPSGFDSGTLEDLGIIMMQWAEDHYITILGSQLTFTGVKITDLSTESGGVYENSPAGTVTGGNTTGEAFPNNTAVVVSWKTLSRGRSFRGRTFVPGIRSSMVTLNTVGGTFNTSLTTALNTLTTETGAGGFVQVITSLCNGKAWRTTGVSTPVSSYVINPTVAAQRRRLPGRGA